MSILLSLLRSMPVRHTKRPPEKELRSRQMVYFPAALVFTLAFGFGIIKFTTFEVTAITTVPQGETAQVYVPVTPTPRPSPTPPPTLAPGAEVGAMTWDGYFSGLVQEPLQLMSWGDQSRRVESCHLSGCTQGW